jgi:hypothetical protein
LLYKSNYLDSLIAACGAISKRGKCYWFSSALVTRIVTSVEEAIALNIS